jgi:hypothetical protein
MRNNIMRLAYNFEPKYRVIMLTREEITKDLNLLLYLKGLSGITDGSKTQKVNGAGVYGQSLGRKLIISLGRYTTVFQAGIHAILACVYKIQTNVTS